MYPVTTPKPPLIFRIFDDHIAPGVKGVLLYVTWDTAGSGSNPSGTPRRLMGSLSGTKQLKRRWNPPNRTYPTSPTLILSYWPAGSGS